MPPSNIEDQDRINHILAECEFLLALKPTISPSRLETDGIIFRAVCYSFVIIGESCHHLSAGYKATIPEIDWPLPYLMRNISVHSYNSVDSQILWDTIIKEVPKLQIYISQTDLV
ncbi:MAG: DUF86 domain-containing protein [Candidatus Pacebacteria bacterium]|nr:DUF86 domain-containing protein [Candidatus Paceibacterota bacterium]